MVGAGSTLASVCASSILIALSACLVCLNSGSELGIRATQGGCSSWVITAVAEDRYGT